MDTPEAKLHAVAQKAAEGKELLGTLRTTMLEWVRVIDDENFSATVVNARIDHAVKELKRILGEQS